MISLEEYEKIISELMDELPEAFFQKLSGGVIVSEVAVMPDYAQGNDLYTMGEYQIYSGIRQIVMFKGSFDRAYPCTSVSMRFEGFSVMNSAIILNIWEASIIRHRWKHRMSGINKHICPNMEFTAHENGRSLMSSHLSLFGLSYPRFKQ